MISAFDTIAPRDRVIVALDCDVARAKQLASQLAGRAKWIKVGMTLFYDQGPTIIHFLKECGFKVFLDLKFHDIPHQVEGATLAALRCGADMLTVHAMGGVAMMEAAQGAVRGAALECGEVPVTLGITVLTSMDEQSLAQIGVCHPLSNQVLFLAQQACKAGLSGVVASAKEAAPLRQTLGEDAYIVTPGIRPEGYASQDQSRVTTAACAFAAGASHIVVGRPITEAPHVKSAFDALIESISN